MKDKDKICLSYKFKHKNMWCYYIWEPIFHENWLIAFCPKWSDYRDMAERQYGDKLDTPGQYVEGRCSTHINDTGDCITYIWLKKFSYAKLAHEIIHGVLRIFNHRGIQVNCESDEFFAYYHEFIINQLEGLRK